MVMCAKVENFFFDFWCDSDFWVFRFGFSQFTNEISEVYNVIMKGQSEEIRKLAVSALNSGQSASMLAEIFGVSCRTIYRWRKEAERGQTAGKKRGHRPRCLSAEEEKRLDELVCESPDKTLAELRSDLDKQCSLPTIMRALCRLGYRFKKNAEG